MKISELVSALNKAAQLVGDAPIVLKDIEKEAETAFKAVVVTIDAATGETGSSVLVTHGTAPASTGTDTADTPPAAPVDTTPPPVA